MRRGGIDGRHLRPSELTRLAKTGPGHPHLVIWNERASSTNCITRLPARASDESLYDRRFPHLRGSRRCSQIAELVRSCSVHPRLHRLKASLLTETGVQVLDFPFVRYDIDPEIDEAHEPARNYVCVLVLGVNNATLQAIEYAETLRPTDLRAVTFGLDPKRPRSSVTTGWSARIPHPLEIEDSPFRDIGSLVIHYVTQFEADGVDRVVTVVSSPSSSSQEPPPDPSQSNGPDRQSGTCLFETGVVVGQRALPPETDEAAGGATRAPVSVVPQ